MTRKEKESLKCQIISTQLISRQGLYECLGILSYHLENQNNLDTSAIKKIVRKLNIVESNLNKSNDYIKTYFN